MTYPLPRRFRVIEDAYLWGELVAKAGDEVYEFRGATYGCISFGGIACSATGPYDNPFFEIKEDNLELIEGEG